MQIEQPYHEVLKAALQPLIVRAGGPTRAAVVERIDEIEATETFEEFAAVVGVERRKVEAILDEFPGLEDWRHVKFHVQLAAINDAYELPKE